MRIVPRSAGWAKQRGLENRSGLKAWPFATRIDRLTAMPLHELKVRTSPVGPRSNASRTNLPPPSNRATSDAPLVPIRADVAETKTEPAKSGALLTHDSTACDISAGAN